MELFARISYGLTAGDVNIEKDDYINEVLNEKLKSFVNSKGITAYRILNAESSFIPEPSIGAGSEAVLCSLYIAYQSVDK